MAEGWILLHRKIAEHELWLEKPFDKARAWVDMILLANFKESSFWVRGQEVKVGRGQLAWSEVSLSDRWGWSRNKIRLFLKTLKTKQQIEQLASNVTSLITIVNYEQYQLEGTPNYTPDDTADGTHKKEGKEGKEKTIVPFAEIIGYLNLKAGKNFKAGDAHKRHIGARWKEGHTLEDFKKVIDSKVETWGPDEKMAVYLRPETLFGTKFDSYLQIAIKTKHQPVSSKDADLAERRRRILNNDK